MNILVDTSVWSLAFRKKLLSPQEQLIIDELKELIRELRVVIIGPIRQEILSGISDKRKYDILKNKMRIFTNIELTTSDYETAAAYFNLCRNKGIQGSQIDFLICATAKNHNCAIFTLDKDFSHYKTYLDINLYTIRTNLC